MPAIVLTQEISGSNQATLNQLLSEAINLKSKGTKEASESSIQRFTQALKLIRSSRGDRPLEADVLFLIASTNTQLGDYQQALASYNEALTIFRSIPNPRKEAATLSNIGSVFGYQEDHRRALDYYSQALSVAQAIGDVQAKISSQNNVGFSWSALGQQQKAIEYFNESLSLSQLSRDQKSEATALSNLGVAYGLFGDQERALDYLKRALPLRRAALDREGEAVTLEAIGGRYNAIGDKQQALDYFSASLTVAKAIGYRRAEASTLNNIGAVYESIGETARALKSYADALPVKESVGDRRGKAATLGNMGVVFMQMGESQKALEYFKQSLALFDLIADRNGQAAIHNNIGSIYESQGLTRAALNSYSEVLALSRSTGARGTESAALNNLAGVHLELGEMREAQAYYEKALALVREIGDRRHEASVLSNVAALEAKRGNLKEALETIHAAIEIFESIRGGIVAQESRSAFFASIHNHYEFLIDLLIRLHQQNPSLSYDAFALQTSERARARGFLELLQLSQADIHKDVDSELLARERLLERRLSAEAESRVILLSGPHTDAEAIAKAAQIEQLRTDYQDVKTLIRRNNPNYGALTQPQPLNLKEIQQQLGADTVLLEYALGNAQSYLLFVSDAGMKSFALPPKREIEVAVRAFHALLSVETDSRNAEALQRASALSKMLLGPVASQLERKRLVIVADGALQYLPFSVLTDPAFADRRDGFMHPLILAHEVVNLPSMSVLATLRTEELEHKPAPRDLAVLADPVFSADDNRVNTRTTPRENADETLAELAGTKAGRESGVMPGGRYLDRLPGTRNEANRIAALVPPDRVLKALDFAANKELVKSGELATYRYLMFATHGLLDSIHPELTAIALSLVDQNGNHRDGYLRAYEVYNLKLSAEVVVLSGCDTALGKEIRGEGLVGLTRAFMYAGTARVVASLWSVKDDSTAALMVDFYQGMIKDRKRPAEALRAAQIRMFQSKEWQAPHYWAPFVLQGEWK